jgi:aerobic C4-dicarboxylate transport protein
MGEAAPAKRPFYRLLYVQVLFAILLGFLFGWLFPDVAQSDWVKRSPTASSSSSRW